MPHHIRGRGAAPGRGPGRRRGRGAAASVDTARFRRGDARDLDPRLQKGSDPL